MKFAKTIPFFIFILLFCQCSNEKSSKNLLIVPENWRTEVLDFPIEFAPKLDYTGFENVCFAPGWGTKGSPEYFSCAFLWVVDENPKLSAKKLELEIETYFDGLMQVVSSSDQNTPIQIPKSKAFFEKVKDNYYVGKLLTYDAFTTKKELKLNFIVNTNYCGEEKKHHVFFKISPQDTEHPIWKKMNTIKNNIVCK